MKMIKKRNKKRKLKDLKHKKNQIIIKNLVKTMTTINLKKKN